MNLHLYYCLWIFFFHNYGKHLNFRFLQMGTYYRIKILFSEYMFGSHHKKVVRIEVKALYLSWWITVKFVFWKPIVGSMKLLNEVNDSRNCSKEVENFSKLCWEEWAELLERKKKLWPTSCMIWSIQWERNNRSPNTTLYPPWRVMKKVSIAYNYDT